MKKKFNILVLAGAVLAIAAGVSYAAIPGSNGTISACKDNKGALKVIDADAGQTCGTNQQLLTWNQQGPQGPAGQDGVSGYELVYGPGSSYDSLVEKSDVATCPSGKKPVGGGAILWDYSGYGVPEDVALIGSQSTGNGWGVAAREMAPKDEDWMVRSQAICVTAQ